MKLRGVIYMFDFKKSKYFTSLPKPHQDAIMQSHVEFFNDNDLEKFVTNIDHYKSENMPL